MQSLRKNGKKNGLIALLAWLKFSAMFIYAYESGEILGIKLGCDHKPNKKIIIMDDSSSADDDLNSAVEESEEAVEEPAVEESEDAVEEPAVEDSEEAVENNLSVSLKYVDLPKHTKGKKPSRRKDKKKSHVVDDNDYD